MSGGGGGLTPSDLAPARLSQQQIGELERQYEIADVLPLTPLQRGLLFHAGAAQGPGDDVYAVQLEITVSGPLDPHRLGAAVQTVVGRHPQLVARFCERFGEPVQILAADPVAPWRYVDLDTGGDVDVSRPRWVSRSRRCVPLNAPRSAIWPASRRFGRCWFAPQLTGIGWC